jgi:hypothetical protein
LANTQQRLEDCIVEMSTKTATNFEMTKEDSTTQMDEIEATLQNYQSVINDDFNRLEYLTKYKFTGLKQSMNSRITTLNNDLTNQIDKSLIHFTAISNQNFQNISTVLVNLTNSIERIEVKIKEIEENEKQPKTSNVKEESIYSSVKSLENDDQKSALAAAHRLLEIISKPQIVDDSKDTEESNLKDIVAPSSDDQLQPSLTTSGQAFLTASFSKSARSFKSSSSSSSSEKHQKQEVIKVIDPDDEAKPENVTKTTTTVKQIDKKDSSSIESAEASAESKLSVSLPLETVETELKPKVEDKN